MRIGVVGTSAAARDLTERLAQGGNEVVAAPYAALVSGAPYAALVSSTPRAAPVSQAKRAALRRSGQRRRVEPAADVTDAVFVDVRTEEVPAAIAAARPLVGPDSLVVPIVKSASALRPFVAAFGVERVAIGQYTMALQMTLGELDHEPSARVVRLARTLEEAGIATAVSLDIHAALSRSQEG
jgi:2-dehydropantoate 2-reductase